MSPARATSLNRARRDRELARLADPDRSGRGRPVDLLIVGGGVTGCGIALDAAARGLSAVLVERADLGHGTSRWSSKLVHGGLRYLAHGDVRIARESAVERGRIMAHIAPHLTRALPMLFPRLPGASRTAYGMIGAGLAAGEALRLFTGTGAGPGRLPAPRPVTRAEAVALVPALRPDVTGGLLGWEGQLTDDARLVTALARTAAGYGARILTRVEASEATGGGARLTDRLGGGSFDLAARAVVNATGVWAGRLAPGVRLRPSRGTHIVLPEEAFGRLPAAVSIPVPGERARYVFALPVPRTRRVYVGITDVPESGEVPDVPEPTEAEIGFLLETVNTALDHPLRRTDVIGAYAGLRPLLDSGEGADLSRRHAVLGSRDGLVTVVGGKLTTYRRMAQDAVDAVVRTRGLRPLRPCRTARLPLVGVATPAGLAQLGAPARLLAGYGAEAADVLEIAELEPDLAAPLADGIEVTGAEVAFAIRHEGALDESDILDRRTRIGLVPADRDRALPQVRRILAAGGPAG